MRNLVPSYREAVRCLGGRRRRSRECGAPTNRDLKNGRRIDRLDAGEAPATRARPRSSQTSGRGPSNSSAERSEGQTVGSRDTAHRAPGRSSEHTRLALAPLPLPGRSPWRGGGPRRESMPSSQGIGGASYQVSLCMTRGWRGWFGASCRIPLSRRWCDHVPVLKVPRSATRRTRTRALVDALVAYLQSSEPTLDDKNRAIWLLGELRDRRALPALRALDRGDVCDHARFVCQRDRRKAIDKIRGNRFEPPAFHWP